MARSVVVGVTAGAVAPIVITGLLSNQPAPPPHELRLALLPYVTGRLTDGGDNFAPRAGGGSSSVW